MSEAPSCAPSLRAARAQQQCRLARSNHQDEASAGRGANHSGVSLGAHAEHARTSESPQQLLPSSFSLETPGLTLCLPCVLPPPPPPSAAARPLCWSSACCSSPSLCCCTSGASSVRVEAAAEAPRAVVRLEAASRGGQRASTHVCDGCQRDDGSKSWHTAARRHPRSLRRACTSLGSVRRGLFRFRVSTPQTARQHTTQPQADDPELRHRVRAVVIFYTWRVGGGARSTILTINTVHVILYVFAPQKKRYF